MVQTVWTRIPDRYPNAALDGVVVMPNHLHGIIRLEPGQNGEPIPDAPSLSDIVRWFKIQTSMKYGDGVRNQRWPRYTGHLWQSGYMNHVIRSESTLLRLQNYMESNPALWEDDTFHPDAKRPQSPKYGVGGG